MRVFICLFNVEAYYNNDEGTGCTLNATTYMRYGTFSATVKAGSEPGSVTAVILIADNGDEIDFELLATSENQITQVFSLSLPLSIITCIQ